MRGPGLRRGDRIGWIAGFYDMRIGDYLIAHSGRWSRYDFNGTLITLYARWHKPEKVDWILQGRGWLLRVDLFDEAWTVLGFHGDERRAVEDLTVMRLLFPPGR